MAIVIKTVLGNISVYQNTECIFFINEKVGACLKNMAFITHDHMEIIIENGIQHNPVQVKRGINFTVAVTIVAKNINAFVAVIEIDISIIFWIYADSITGIYRSIGAE